MHVVVESVWSHRLAHQSIEIAVPVEQVFDYAIDLKNFPDWFPGATSVQAVDGSPVGRPGKQYRESVRLPSGRQQQVTICLKQAVRPQRFVTEGDLPWLLPRMDLEFLAVGPQSTRLMWTMSTRRRGIALILVLPLLRIVLDARGRSGLRRLKALLESVGSCG